MNKQTPHRSDDKVIYRPFFDLWTRSPRTRAAVRRCGFVRINGFGAAGAERVVRVRPVRIKKGDREIMVGACLSSLRELPARRGITMIRFRPPVPVGCGGGRQHLHGREAKLWATATAQAASSVSQNIGQREENTLRVVIGRPAIQFGSANTVTYLALRSLDAFVFFISSISGVYIALSPLKGEGFLLHAVKGWAVRTTHCW